ncbi:MAG: beta-glucosidase family protein [Flavobacteriales bacterium]
MFFDVKQGYSKAMLTGAVLTIAVLVGCSNPAVERDNLDQEEARFVDSVLQTLSLEAKVGEMTQLTLGAIAVGKPFKLVEPQRLDSNKAELALVDFHVGSILNCGNHAHTPEKWHEFINGIQDFAQLKSSPTPVLYGVDAIHGPTYTSGGVLSPQQIGLAATWDIDLTRNVAEATASQIKACGIPWNFSPVLDLGRDPRWPRFWETFGEDPLLASRMGVAMVEGYQNGPDKVAATLKHFLGYSFPLSGKDRTPAWIPERELREYFLPSFQAAIEGGAMSIMVNSGEINGIPVHANRKLLTDLLRDELGFDGVIVTDWEDIGYLQERHKVAEDYKEATRMAVEAGIDMSMVPLDLEFSKALIELVEEGVILETRIDESVRRILTMKYRLGLFKTKGYAPSFEEYPETADFEGAAARAALESITLLKNDLTGQMGFEHRVLPISGSGKIFVTGPTAHSLNALNGGWTGTWQGTDTTYNTPGRPHLTEALQAHFGVDRIEDMRLEMTFNDNDVAKVVDQIRRTNPDYVILALGEMPYTELVGNDENLELYANQQALVKAVHALQRPIIAVFIEGRPRTFQAVEPMMDGIVMAYLPGDYGGQAIAQVLDGSFNPTGRLPFTWPRYASSHLTYYHKHTERIDTDFSLNGFNPQFEFGHGLSYSEVKCEELKSDQQHYGINDTIRLEVTLHNLGDRSSDELILVFSQDKVASITPSVKRLRDFKRKVVGGREKVVVDFELPISSLSFVNENLQKVTEPGEFVLHVQDKTVDILVSP